MEYVSQSGCVVSILGDIKNSTGHCPRQPAVGDPVLSKELD